MMSDTKTLFQHGTLALLVPGLLTGTATMADILAHGDTGIGTGEGLDGELIILDGVVYQADANGQINEVDAQFTTPFANSHFASYEPLVTVSDQSRAALQAAILTASNSANTFFSIRLHGIFKNVTTRVVKKSTKPYKTLAQTAASQVVFHRDLVEGTLLSYYAPQIFDGAAVGGFHSHFLADDHRFGGHLLSYETATGEVDFQQFDRLDQQLPTSDAVYMNHDFSADDILESIHKSE